MANVITGAKAIVKIGGETVGYATGISINESTLNGRVESLGFIDSREITPIGRAVTATCNMIRIFKTNAENGLGSGEVDDSSMINSQQVVGGDVSLSQRTFDVLNLQPFDLEIWDNSPSPGEEDDVKMYTVKGCVPAGQQIVVDRGSLMGVQVNLDALYLIRHVAAGVEP